MRIDQCLVWTVAALSLATGVSAQCTLAWRSMASIPGANALVACSAMWDRDGGGPQPPRLVLGGAFTMLGDTAVSGPVVWDETQAVWSTLATGISGTVNAILPLAGGRLVAGGVFTDAGGVAVSNIAIWDGTMWTPTGSGMDAAVRALALLPNGDLVAGGAFTNAGGVAANHVARWNGQSWSPLGLGTNGSVGALAIAPNGDVVAGGDFTDAGGAYVGRLARWDGTTWASVGGGVGTPQSGSVSAIRSTANGELWVGGDFATAGSGSTGPVATGSLARWNGSQWQALGGAFQGSVRAFATEANGDVLVAGNFASAGGVACNNVARWNGVAWSALGAGTNGLACTVTSEPGGSVVVGGGFTACGTVSTSCLARYSGSWSAFHPVTQAINGVGVSVLENAANGALIVGGGFSNAGGVSAARIAQWTGSTWYSMGNGFSLPWSGSNVNDLVALPNGDVIAVGSFFDPNPLGMNNAARWSGTTYTWGALGGYVAPVSAAVLLPNGDLAAASTNYFPTPSEVVRFDGTTWYSMGANFDGSVKDLVVLPNGDLIAGGFFTKVWTGGSSFVTLNRVARRSGNTWQPLGAGLSRVGSVGQAFVWALAVLPSGTLVVAGNFTHAGGAPANNIASWNGTSWSALGSGLGSAANDGVYALHVLPNGDLLAGGAFTLAGSTIVNSIARWNGVAWSAVGAGVNYGPGYGIVSALCTRPNGDVMVGGNFTSAGGMPSPNLARLTSTCPATATLQGFWCSGSAGVNQLTALNRPWIGATFRSRTTGVVANRLAVSVLGLTSTYLPLTQVFPQAGSTCVLQVTPAVLTAHITGAGSLDVQWGIPNNAALVGAMCYQQVVPFETDAQGSITAVTASNALSLRLGAL